MGGMWFTELQGVDCLWGDAGAEGLAGDSAGECHGGDCGLWKTRGR